MSDLKISGFTFIKNGLELGYPFFESIQSIDPFCDEIIINVGFDDSNLQQDDGTMNFIQKNFKGPKYKIIKSYWDPKIKERGLILSEQTNVALKHCQGDFCQYIQGDEAIHEYDVPAIFKGVQHLHEKKDADGLVFNYIHFYGNVNIVRHTRNVYRREVRLIRNGKNIVSWLDAQGFRYQDGTKVPCVQIPASIYHYGWARRESVMNKKVKSFSKLYHGDNFENSEFSYERLWGLRSFTKTHPKPMQGWIDKHKNNVDIMALPLSFKFKDLGLVFSDAIEKITDYRIGEYKNFKLVGKI